MNREFFTAVTVGEALRGFRPAGRTAVERVALADALHRVPAADVRAPAALPGFARSTVDGYAVRAADTYGASEGLPYYLDLAGAVRMGTAPAVAVAPGACVAIPTGAVLPDGADVESVACALREDGSAFTVDCSHGVARVPACPAGAALPEN